MKKGQIVQYINYLGEETLAVCDGEHFYELFHYGYKEVLPKNYETAIVSDEIKELYLKLLDSIMAIKAAEKLIKESREAIAEIPHKLNEAKGLLSEEEFSERLTNGLGMMNTDVFIRKDKIVVYEETTVENHYQGSMARQGYDGSYYLVTNNAIAQREYDVIINKFARNRNINAKCSPKLVLDEDSSLILVERYTINYDLPLTPDNCDSLIAKLKGSNPLFLCAGSQN